MKPDAVEDRIKSILSKILDLTPGEIRINARFVEDLGADSLHKMELIMALEETFHLEVSEADAQTFVCAQDVIAYIHRHSQLT